MTKEVVYRNLDFLKFISEGIEGGAMTCDKKFMSQ